MLPLKHDDLAHGNTNHNHKTPATTATKESATNKQ
jgi:hypothetical protein